VNFQIGKSWESMNFAGNPLPAKGLRCDVIFLEKVGWVGIGVFTQDASGMFTKGKIFPHDFAGSSASILLAQKT